MNISNIVQLGVQRAPAAAADLQAALRQGRWSALPGDLEQLLSQSNGFLTPGGISLYGTDDLAERNQTYEIDQYSEGFLLIGDNSGGKGYLMQLGRGESPVYSSDLGDLDIPGFQKEAGSLQDWIDSLR
jgi:hypothetical protein